ncbi:hypothetical protein AKI39_14635 [Bordetella sp. H567]|uniref:hypothetical protein n=1 Tax=Bordetella sp. H567 TaxID=1697043 RepID=UPI00081CFB40|nr:hypothetical protein [Bordetella sp. H567]AOB31661.1 hypothetical protein AKI39_14635 [Bordetella sp. H567]
MRAVHDLTHLGGLVVDSAAAVNGSRSVPEQIKDGAESLESAYLFDDSEGRRQLVALTQAMLAGELPFFEGAVWVVNLRHRLNGIGDDDPDFRIFFSHSVRDRPFAA